MTPYYQDSAVTIYHGDCLEIVPTLGRFDLLLTDPPYGKVKGDFDEAWTNRPAMLKDCACWRDMMFAAMKPNATLWWFAWPSLAGRIEAILAETLNPLAHVVWIKPTSLAQKHCPEALRAPGPETERILMAEHYGADNTALGESGYAAKCDALRGFIFEPLRAYLDGERVRAGVSKEDINEALGFRRLGGMAGRHYFSASQWQLPTHDHYARMRNAMNKTSQHNQYLRREYEDLRQEYEDLRREYEDLRREYDDLRRYFALQRGDPKTDVWRFGISGNRTGHPTEKPIDLIAFMVRISCRPGGIILDPFAGSGTTGRAAKDLGRKAVLIEREEKYCEIAAKRMAQETLSFFPNADSHNPARSSSVPHPPAPSLPFSEPDPTKAQPTEPATATAAEKTRPRYRPRPPTPTKSTAPETPAQPCVLSP